MRKISPKFIQADMYPRTNSRNHNNIICCFLRKGFTIIWCALVFLACYVPASVVADQSGWLWPVDPKYKLCSRGFIISPEDKKHYAIDIEVNGVEVLAAKSGTIVAIYRGCNNQKYLSPYKTCTERGICNPTKNGKPFSKTLGYCCNHGFGNGVVIDHGGIYSQYAHMKTVYDKITVGMKVTQGTPLGISGSYGNSGGPHLHFGISTSFKNLDENDFYNHSINNNPRLKSYGILEDWPDGHHTSLYDAKGVDYLFGNELLYSSTNGEVEGNFASGSCVEKGMRVTLNAVPDSGYTFTNWSITGVTGVSETSNPLEFDMPDNDVTITANYKLNSFTISKKWSETTANASSSNVAFSAKLIVDASKDFLVQFPHQLSNIKIMVSKDPNLSSDYHQSFDIPTPTIIPIEGGKRYEYSFSISSDQLVNDSGQKIILEAGAKYYYRWWGVVNNDGCVSNLAQFNVPYNNKLTKAWISVTPKKAEYEVGDVITISYGADYEHSDFWLHKLAGSINGEDTCECVARNKGNGSKQITLSSVGENYYYIVAENVNNRSVRAPSWIDNNLPIKIKVVSSVVPAVGTLPGDNPLVTWFNLHTEDSRYGLFNAQVSWNKSVSMNEVGCFVSTDRINVSNAKKNSYSGCAMRKDSSIVIASETDTTYGTIVFYKGPSFDTISSFVPGTTYYYKFYSITNDGKEAHSEIASYTPGGSTGSTNPKANVQPGVYVIHSAWDDNICLDITSNSRENNANIQLYHRVYDDVQKFEVIKADNTYFYVKSVYNSLWLDAKTPLGNNSNVKLYNTNTGTENYWYFEDAGNGYVYIRNKSGYYLDVQGDKAVDHANVQLYQFVGNNSQKWRLEAIASTQVQFNLSVEVYGGKGGSAAASGTVFSEGQPATLTATPATGYKLDHWYSDNGGTFGNQYSLTTSFTMPAGNTKVTAVFKPIDYQITVETAGNGSGSINTPAAGTYGNTVDMTATPDEGYYFAGWESSDITISQEEKTNTTLRFTMPPHDVKVKAYFMHSSTELTDWHEGVEIPSGYTAEELEIQYKHKYITVSATSPGAGWTQESVKRTYYQNSGSIEEYPYERSTSSTYEYVGGYYYHWCGSNHDCNYQKTAGKYETYHGPNSLDDFDIIKTGTDTNNSNVKWYRLQWKSGRAYTGEAWCASMQTANWYRMYQYQPKVLVTEYNWVKETDWTNTNDPGAASVTIRWRLNPNIHFHSLIIHEKTDATCIETGIEEYWECISCGTLFSDAEGQYQIIEPMIIPAKGHTLTAHAELKADCTKEGTEAYWHCDVCEMLFSDSGARIEIEEPLIIPATGHAWDTPTYTWYADYSKVTATRTCKTNEAHQEWEIANTFAEVTRQPTFDQAGETTYTAEFTNEAFKTQIISIENIPKLDYNWGIPTYTWSADFSKVTARRVSKADESVIQIETVKTTGRVKKEATCTQPGEMAYTSDAFENEAFDIQIKTVEVPALGHEWGEATYKWNSNNSKVTASRFCARDVNHVETETAAVHRMLASSPTETKAGSFVWISNGFANTAFEEQRLEGGTIPALKDLDVLKLPSAMTTIEEEAFSDVPAEAIIIPEHCKTIGPKAFMNCRNLIYIRIPAGVEIAVDAFDGSLNVLIDKR